LLDTMFELPGMVNVQKVVVEDNAISGDGKPLLIFSESSKVAGSH
jgi:ATP-dependent Clp protease ATP-binding subunit ClpX